MDEKGKHQLSLQALKKFRIIFGSVRKQYREIERTCGVTGPQMWIMQEVAQAPGIGVSELASRLSIHQSTTSQLVEKLVARSLIHKERSIEDQRRVGLRLTEKASRLLHDAPGPAEGILPDALRALPESALHSLDNALLEVIGQLRLADNRLADKPLADL